MSKGGISADEVMQQEVLERLNEYRGINQEMIKVNIKLMKITEERLALGKKTISNSKEHAKLDRLENNTKKQRLKIGKELNKQSKLNSSIRKDANNNQINAIKLQKRLNVAIKKETIVLEKNTRAVRKNKSQLKKFKSGLKNFFNPANIGIGIVIGSLYKLLGTVKETITLIKKLDSLEMSMGVALRDDKDALKRTMGELTIMSYKYGQNLLTLTERYNKFLVASKSSNISLSDTENIFETITKASAVLGLSNEELKGSLLAIEQMMSKGKITTEELRRQLGERMPGAVGIMADAMGVGIEKLGEMMKKGEVLTEDVLPAFAEAMKNAYNLDTVDNIDTLIAAQERSNTAWIEMVRSIDDGSGAMSNLLKWWYKVKTDIFVFLTSWNEKLIRREYFAIGVNSAKAYLKGYSSKITSKQDGFDELGYVAKLKIKKAIELSKAREKIDPNLHIYDKEGNQIDNLTEKLEKHNNELEKQDNLLTKIKEKYDKQNNKYNGVAGGYGGGVVLSNVKLEDTEEFKKAIKKRQNIVEELSILQGHYDEYKRRVNEVEKVAKNRIENNNKLINKSKPRLLTKPQIKEFNEYGKSLKVILKSEAEYYKNKIKTASTYDEMKQYLDYELKTRISILNISKKQNDLKVESRYKKELQSIEKKRTSYKNIVTQNNNKAQEIIDKLDKRAENYEKAVAKIRKQFYTPDFKTYNAILDKNKEVAKLKYDFDINYNRTVYQEGLNNIQRQRVERDLKLIQRAYNEELKLGNSLDAEWKSNKLKNLADLMTAKKKNVIDYEHEKERIELEFNKRKIAREIKNQKRLLKHALGLHNETVSYVDENKLIQKQQKLVPNATPDQIEKTTLKIKELEAEFSKLGLTISNLDTPTQVYFQKIEAFINKFSSQFNDMVNAIRESVNASYQADIDAQDKKLKNLKDYYEKQNELAGDSEYKKKLLRDEEEVATKKIEARKRKLRIQQAKADKRFAIFNAEIGAAQAIVNVFATSSPPYSFILAGMIAATTLIKINNIKKEKIPEYKLGTDYHPKDGLAIVGDGGKQEVVESKGKTFLTPDKPTFAYLYKGDKVYKDKADYIKNKANKLLDNSIKNDTFVVDNGNVENAILQGFGLIKSNNNISISIQNNNPYKAFKKL